VESLLIGANDRSVQTIDSNRFMAKELIATAKSGSELTDAHKAYTDS